MRNPMRNPTLNPMPSILLCANSLRRWWSNPRYYVLFILEGLLIHILTRQVLDFSVAAGVKSTPWVFPFMLSDYRVSTIILVGAVLLFCDAPFMNECTPYECVRSGKTRWVVGQLLYVLVASVVYVLFLIVVSVLTLAPSLYLDLSWGRVITTLAQTSAGGQVSFPISNTILQEYSPIQAFALSSFLLVLEIGLIGLATFAINMSLKRIGGIVVALTLVFLPTVFEVSGNAWTFYLAPTTWSNLTIIDATGISVHPPVSYATFVLVAACLVLTVLILRISKKQEIVVLQSI